MFKKTVFVTMTLMLVLAACSPSPKVTDVMMDSPTDAMMDSPTVAAGMDGDPMMEAPAWFGVTLTDVRSGEGFSIQDFKGKVVVVEDLAMWCSNCKKQQNQVKILLEELGMNEDLVFIGLDIDPNENAADLKTYTDNNGFNWLYVVAPVEVAREIGNLYGDQFLNPPSTPMFLVDRKGQVHPMPFGVKSAEELKNFIEPFLSDNM